MQKQNLWKSKVAWTTMIDMYYNNIIISHIMQTL